MKSFKRFGLLVMVICGILVSLTFFSFDFVLAADNVNSVDKVRITVPISCSVIGTIASGGEHTATMMNSQYLSNIGTTTFKTYCNDNNGYSIYAVGFSNDETGNTLMKHDSDSTHDYNTGTATSGNTSEWAMKLTAISGTYAPTIHSDGSGPFSNYHAVPNSFTKVASFSSNTDLPATGVNAVGSGFTSTYATWISATQVAGTYTGKVKYILVHPVTATAMAPVSCSSGKICYNANTNMAVGSMGKQSANAESEVVLLASNFSRDGYGFAGWNTKYDYSGTYYGPNETITTPADMTSGLPLYAVWVESEGTIQDWNGCAGLTTATYTGNTEDETDWTILKSMSSITALTDIRDNQTYAVARLADGICWMIENMRLKTDGSDIGSASQGFGGVFNGLADYETAYFAADTTANTLYRVDSDTTSSAPNIIDTATHTVSETDYSGYSFPRFNDTNTRARASSPTASTGSIYSYGVYYTWAAAKANTTHFSAVAASNSATTSICPHGWRLPTGVGTGDYGILSNALGGYTNASNTAQTMSSSTTPAVSIMSKRLRTFPNNIVYSGRFSANAAGQRGTYSYYWTATARNHTTAYNFRTYSTYVNPGQSYSSYFLGFPLRCVTGT